MPDSVPISLDALREALLSFGFPLLIVIISSFTLGFVVFGPIRVATKYPLRGTRYNISDIVVLLLQTQVVAGLVFTYTSTVGSLPAQRLSIGIVVCVILGAWWLAGIRMLARAQIINPHMRCWFLGLLVPFGFAVAGLALWLPFALIASITILFLACTWGYWDLLRTLIPIVSFAGAHVAGILICRLACKLIVKNGQAARPAMTSTSMQLR